MGLKTGVGVLVVALALGGPAATLGDNAEGTGLGWSVAFQEVSGEVGIDFRLAGEVHDPAGEDFQWPGFPEILGAGACWADLTGDGYEDLYVPNQRYNELNPYSQGYNGLFDPVNRFYVNDADGAFVDATFEAGLESRSHDQGCSVADFDADGHLDLLVTGYGSLKLFRNGGDGSFADVTRSAGLDRADACLPFDCWHTCSAWGDYDGDGDLDLFLCTYVETDMKDDQRGPGFHVAQFNALYRNEGDATFTEVAAQAGVEGVAADVGGSKTLGVVWTDADLDGWLDLYVVNDMTPNEFYWNDGDATFTRDDEAGLYDNRAGMGVTVGDFDANGYPDFYFTHYQRQHNGFYRNGADGTWTDLSGTQGHAADFDFVGWGTRFVDLDRDGYLDVVAANGHTAWVSSDYDQETLVVRQEPQGNGSPVWVDRTQDSGPGIQMKRVSRGAAFGDMDYDGNVDVVVGNNANQSLQFLRGSGAPGHWLYVQPVQAGPNHQAIGARVVVETPDGATRHHEVRAGSSYLSQDSLLADFGLAGHDRAQRVTVHWPGGGSTVVEDVPADLVVRIDRTTGTYTTDTLSPVTTALLSGDAGEDGWFAGDVEVDFGVEDRAVGPPSGVAVTQARFNEGSWWVYEDESIPAPVDEGWHMLEYHSEDHVGNVEPLHREGFGVDRTPPGVGHEIDGTPGSNGWWTSADLVLSAEDPLSGVQRIRYRVDAGPWQTYHEPVPFGEGVRYVEYAATDRAGNEAVVQGLWLNVDPTPPAGRFARPLPGHVYLDDEEVEGPGPGPALMVNSPAGEEGEGLTVITEAEDATSGVARVDLFLNGEPVAVSHGAGPVFTWQWDTRGKPSGTYLLQAVVQDVAGNPGSASRFVTLLPATPEGLGRTVQEGPSLYPLLPGPGLPD